MHVYIDTCTYARVLLLRHLSELSYSGCSALSLLSRNTTAPDHKFTEKAYLPSSSIIFRALFHDSESDLLPMAHLMPWLGPSSIRLRTLCGTAAERYTAPDTWFTCGGCFCPSPVPKMNLIASCRHSEIVLRCLMLKK